MSGWIKLHRAIMDHWIYKNDMYLKAWITMLLEVNHVKNKVLIEGELIECNKGQSLKSVEGWAKKFGNGWTRQRVRTFFTLLQNDQIINLEGLRKTTRLTICKYETYQSEVTNKQPTKQPTANQQLTTNKNEENEKNKEIEDITVSPSASTLPKTNYQLLTEMYFSWYENEVGMKPLFNGKEGKAMKSIVAHFEKNAKDKGFDHEKGVIGAWAFILANWGKLNDFERGGKNIAQIASNLNNILDQLKNGTSKDRKQNKFANTDF